MMLKICAILAIILLIILSIFFILSKLIFDRINLSPNKLKALKILTLAGLILSCLTWIMALGLLLRFN